MANASGMGLKRDKPLPLYLSKREKAKIRQMAKEADLSMVEFVRCRIFGIPFSHVGGKDPKPVEATE